MSLRRPAAVWVLLALAGASLAVSAYVHLHLAKSYAYPGTISGTQLFVAQGVVALVVAAVLVVTDSRWAWLAAAVVGLASFAAVMSSRYLDIGAIGPFPDMRDATWHPTPDKPLSAAVEALVVLLALARWAWGRRASRTAQPASWSSSADGRPAHRSGGAGTTAHTVVPNGSSRTPHD